MNSNKFYCLYTVRETKFTIHALLIEPTTTLFKKNIKNDFHDTIHIFKNYFTTVFFSFQLYQNGLILYLVDIYIYIYMGKVNRNLRVLVYKIFLENFY